MNIVILVVTNCDTQFLFLETTLIKINNNYNILRANNQNFIDIILNKTIDLIILDLDENLLKQTKSSEFLKTNSLIKNIPIIFLTNITTIDILNKGFELGAVDYLNKPINELQIKNKVTLYTKLSNEIKENRKKDLLLFQQSKMASMGDMLANIAHQWRQPLSCISTVASGLKIKYDIDILNESELKEDLTQIVNLTQHLSETIDSFRIFFRKDIDKSEFNIKTTIEKALSIVQVLFNNEGIDIEFKGKNYTFYSYENELIQVLLTILNNAKDALEDNLNKKIIFITSEIKDEHLIIKIKDNANVIATNIISNIFDPYFTTQHQRQGTGIGLYIANEIIVKHMRGTITVHNLNYKYNNKDYVGAEFTLKLPL
ncbi:ATP-binding protein [Poseidonibacter sp.]|uniref:ATP-binding protein n=1 Tax=Poseidonibacter sp. TaxID=2321188 RepID=UPI003C72492A